MLWANVQSAKSADINLPIGRVALLNPEHFTEVEYFLQRTRPGDYFFGDEMFKYLLDLRDPAAVSYVTKTAYTRPSQVENVIEGLETHRVKYALWSTDLEMPPASFSGRNNLAPLWDYLQRHYHLVKTFPHGAMVMERKRSPGEPAKLAPAGKNGKLGGR